LNLKLQEGNEVKSQRDLQSDKGQSRAGGGNPRG
jgi:hypothetical protein